jgi:cellulose biosynthesis protein BcsQ
MFGVSTVATPKGGAGKSTLARSVASHSFALGHRPALIDADLQRPLANRHDPHGRLAGLHPRRPEEGARSRPPCKVDVIGAVASA